MTNTPTVYNVATLRDRFIEDMNLHRLSRATQHNWTCNGFAPVT